jgi:hypothetical protein
MRVHKLMRMVVAGGLAMALTGLAWAHCDTTGGPVIADARIALAKGDVTPVLKWVQPAAEAEVKAAFAKAVAVRSKGADAQELADHYFLETLVRVHRAGEGEPYTGIKDEPVAPLVALADQAVANGTAEELTRQLSTHLAAALQQKLARVVAARPHREDSVAAGREYVAAYVAFMHYVEAVHSALAAGAEHHGAAAHQDHAPAAAAPHGH